VSEVMLVIVARTQLLIPGYDAFSHHGLTSWPN